MKKSELAARYDNFGRNLIEISEKEFYQVVDKLKHVITWHNYDCLTEVYKIQTDGVEYICYTSAYNNYNVHDCDSFYFKIITMTQAEREEICKVFP